MNIAAFLSYVIITSVTPGPSNILMMNEGRKFGFIKSWKFNSGILAGFALLGLLSGVFTTSLYDSIPLVEPYFKAAGAAYLLYLAWRVGFRKGSGEDSSIERSSFLSGFIFQLINIKSILFFLTVMSIFVLPYYSSYEAIGFYLSLSILLGWTALLLWSGFGSMFKKFFSEYDKFFRVIMSLLLVYSAASIFT
ncbi:MULTISPECIES: LysE family translocator [Metabacillus]|uniref:Lysine transporter LysE n=1 Tax=Metabacillus indicus TaxID=246786 RepID=A0A084GQF4_METID|nr:MULTISPECIES: LysE family transporter [Metabacillus]KEZ49517.1 lysine transporter LysE [Metabacillus indicus LMG 22858]KEZ49566.1 lysine transporter LysE [Metabacillus indicus]